jgi:hypothetical protein
LISISVTPVCPQSIWIEGLSVDEVTSMLQAIPLVFNELEQITLLNKTRVIRRFCNLCYVLQFSTGSIVRLGIAAADEQAAQILHCDINSPKYHVLIRVFPRIDYEKLRELGMNRQIELNSRQLPDYVVPIAEFDPRQLGGAVITRTLIPCQYKNQAVSLEAVNWDMKVFCERFEILKVPIGEMRVGEDISEEEIKAFCDVDQFFRRNLYRKPSPVRPERATGIEAGEIAVLNSGP